MLEIAALALACVGGGTAIKPTQTEISGSQSGSLSIEGQRGSYNGSFDGTVEGKRAQSYADQVDVELTDSTGRIRLPRIVLPVAHGGQGGWFQLQKLSVDERVIEGSAAVNFMNKPKVHIDRATGTISITGRSGTYVGQCHKVDPDAERKF